MKYLHTKILYVKLEFKKIKLNLDYLRFTHNEGNRLVVIHIYVFMNIFILIYMYIKSDLIITIHEIIYVKVNE